MTYMFSHPKICQLDTAIRIYKYICTFDIPVKFKYASSVNPARKHIINKLNEEKQVKNRKVGCQYRCTVFSACK